MERPIIPKSSSALYLLFAEGFCFLLIGVAVLACGLALKFHSDFDYEQVDIEQDYTQYWVGIVLVITAFLAISAATAQRTRWVVVTAMFLFLATILVSLFALVAEGNDWIQHKNAVRRKEFWESEDYECTSPSDTSCVCTKTTVEKPISGNLDCKTLERLDYLYGGLIGCILAGVFLALSSIVVVLIFIPIRPLTVPVPRTRIREFTVLEEKETKPLAVYMPRERTPQRAHRIVYEDPRLQRQVVHRAPRRQRTLIYDEPRPEEEPVRGMVPIKIPPETELRHKDAEYDVARIVPKDHPSPAKPESVIEEGFIANPNFRKPTRTKQVQLEPVHHGWEEMEPSVRYVRQVPPSVRYVRRQEQEQVRYVQKPTAVYETRPRVVEERALVPVPRSGARPQGRIVVNAEHPQPSYIIERPGQPPLIAIRRQRANSDEGPRLLRAREVRPPPKQRFYPAEPVRTFHSGVPRVPLQRARSNSDEGPRLYREHPGRIYADGEIRAKRDVEVTEFSGGTAKPRVFTEEHIEMANFRHRPANAHMSHVRGVGEYDWNLEANLPTADRWKTRAITPY